MPIFELSGQAPGRSVPKPAWASLQAVWPSAASGLIVRPGGRVSTAERSVDGEEAVPSRNWSAFSWMSMPDGESASAGVRPRLKTGSNFWFSQPVVAG